MSVCIFQFPIGPKIRHKWFEKCYPKDKFEKSTCRICSIYFSQAAFIDNIKFPLWNMNINNLMLIYFHISLITKQFFRSFDRHSDTTVTLSELLPNIDKFRNKILDFFQKVSRRWLLYCSIYCDARLESCYFFKENPSSELIPVLLLQRIAELTPPSYIVYTLVKITICSSSNSVKLSPDFYFKYFLSVSSLLWSWTHWCVAPSLTTYNLNISIVMKEIMKLLLNCV